MKVLVIGLNGRGLAPTTPRKARLLLKDKRAEVYRREPFTIKLLYKTGCAHPHMKLGVDTGSQYIGFAVVTDDGDVLMKEEVELRSSMEKRKLLEKKKEYRRGRRHLKVRYRHPKCRPHTKRVYSEKLIKRNNHMTHWKIIPPKYGTNRQEGWLPPSIQSKVDHHIRWINRHMEALPPDTELVIEVGRFDIQRMKNPNIHGELYQQGHMYDYENVRAYVFDRDGYKCKCCKKKAGTKRDDGTTVKLLAHHIDFRSKGATDNPDRMAAVCDKCHTAKAHKPGGILYQWMIDEKKFSRSYRDATLMNIMRRQIWKAFPEASFTYGNITSADRKYLGLEKSHANDAVTIASHSMETVNNLKQTICYKQIRKQKRSLHEATPRKGRSTKNVNAIRNRKNTPRLKGFYLNDSVEVFGDKGYISGFTGSSSAYVKRPDGTYVTVPGKTYKQISLQDIKLRHRNNNWYTYMAAR